MACFFVQNEKKFVIKNEKSDFGMKKNIDIWITSRKLIQ